tara:strand:- start:840 stop:1676 length:837 start_codon:yes stop_codon:yes gene_type:complete
MKKKIFITGKTRTIKDYILEFFDYIELVFFFTRRDFVVLYKQTVLGPIWYIIQPIITSFVFLIIFNKFAGISTMGVPGLLFYLIGNITWIFFSSSFINIGMTLVNNSDLYKKVYFSRIVLPVSNIFVSYIKFFFQIILFVGVYLYYLLTGFNLSININLVFLPLFIIHLSIFSFSLGLIVASITVKYRDLLVTLQFGIQMLMFATPVIYSFNSIPQKFQYFAYLNPLVPIFENIRNCVFGIPLIDFKYYIVSLVITLLILFLGLKIFFKAEKNFVDFV